MIITIAAAILGAALGLLVRPWLLAPPIAMTAGAAAQGAVMFAARQMGADPAREKMVAALGQVAGTGLTALWPTLAAAGIGALLSTLLGAMADGDSRQPRFWIPDGDEPGRAIGKDGRRPRLPGMVEDREIHARAESRIGVILDL